MAGATPMPGPTIPVATQVAAPAAPAVQTAAIFWPVPARRPAESAPSGGKAPPRPVGGEADAVGPGLGAVDRGVETREEAGPEPEPAGGEAAEEGGAAELVEVGAQGGEEAAAGAAVLEVGLDRRGLGPSSAMPGQLAVEHRALGDLAHLRAEAPPVDRLHPVADLGGRAQDELLGGRQADPEPRGDLAARVRPSPKRRTIASR